MERRDEKLVDEYETNIFCSKQTLSHSNTAHCNERMFFVAIHPYVMSKRFHTEQYNLL